MKQKRGLTLIEIIRKYPLQALRGFMRFVKIKIKECLWFFVFIILWTIFCVLCANIILN